MPSLFDEDVEKSVERSVELVRLSRANDEEQRENKRRYSSGVGEEEERRPFQSQSCGGGRRVIRKRIGGD